MAAQKCRFTQGQDAEEEEEGWSDFFSGLKEGDYDDDRSEAKQV